MTVILEEDREFYEIVGSLSDADKLRLEWLIQARLDQLTPVGDWLIWLVKAGRGFGKTRIGAEDMAHYGQINPGSWLGIVAPTFQLAKNVCLEGESGLLSRLPDSAIDKYNRSEGMVLLKNKSRYQIFSAEEPERLRGPQHHRVWCDELMAWNKLRIQDTWDNLMFGLRLGTRPQCIVTTTPKSHKLLKDLMARSTTVVTNGRMIDNIDNLSEAAIDELVRRYGGTRLGRQELEGEILDDVEGAIWTLAQIDLHRLHEEFVLANINEIADRICVAVDPNVSDEGDECGIVVVAKTTNCPCGRSSRQEPHALVLDDRSTEEGPSGKQGWLERTWEAVDQWSAEDIVAEVNNGGDLVEVALRAHQGRRRAVRCRKVNAARGKRPRAEPVEQLYSQGRVHHVGSHARLEDQMTTWDGTGKSPDRMDAVVWGVTYQLLDPFGSRKKRGGLRG